MICRRMNRRDRHPSRPEAEAAPHPPRPEDLEVEAAPHPHLTPSRHLERLLRKAR